jgi:hypothetical protein
MMGSQDPQPSLYFVVHLDERVPEGHPLRQQCTRAKVGRSGGGRSVKRHDKQAVIDRARKQAASPAARRDRRRRQHLVERSFADASDNHGLKRSRWRRLWRQRIQDLMIARRCRTCGSCGATAEAQRRSPRRTRPQRRGPVRRR